MHSGIVLLDRDSIILAPLKVASRSLLASFPGKQIYWCKSSVHHAILHRLSIYGRKQVFLVMRDPAERLLSCWRDKFRKNPSYVLSLPKNEIEQRSLQGIQSLFLNSCYSSFSSTLGLTESCELLLRTSYSDFVSWLDQAIISKDPHLVSQMSCLMIRWRFVRLVLEPDYIVPIDNKIMLSFFSAKTGFNQDLRLNATTLVTPSPEEQELKPEELIKIRRLYSDDYHLLHLASERSRRIECLQ